MSLARFKPDVRDTSKASPAFGDLKLKWLETREVLVHKLVVAAAMGDYVSGGESDVLAVGEIELVKVFDVSEEDYITGLETLLNYLYCSVNPQPSASVLSLLVCSALADQLSLSSLKELTEQSLAARVAEDVEAALTLLRREVVSEVTETAAVKQVASQAAVISADTLAELSTDRVAKILTLVDDAGRVFSLVSGIIERKIPAVKVKMSISSLVPSGKPWGEKPEAGWQVLLVIDDKRQFQLPSINSISSLTSEEGFSVHADVRPDLDQAELVVGTAKWRFESLRLGANSASNSFAKINLSLETSGAFTEAAPAEDGQEGETVVERKANGTECLELGDLVVWEKLDTESLRQAGHSNIWKHHTHRIVDALAKTKTMQAPDLIPPSAAAVAAPAVETEPPALVVVEPVPAVSDCLPTVARVDESLTASAAVAEKAKMKEVVLQYGSGGWRDQNGLLFLLGTEGGKRLYRNPSGEYVRVLASSSGYGLMEGVAGRARSSFRTKNEADAYLGVELLREATMRVQGYYLRASEEAGRRLVSWEAEVSADGVTWETVDARRDDQTLVLAGEGFFETQLVRENQRWFRVRQTDKNSSGGLNLVIANIELYGALQTKPDNWPQKQ